MKSLPVVGEAGPSRRPTKLLQLLRQFVTDVSEAPVLGAPKEVVKEQVLALLKSERQANQAATARDAALRSLVQLLGLPSQLACNYLDELVLEFHHQM